MKFAYRSEPIVNAPVPSIALIPLLQHAGTQSQCIVNPGDIVREGMLIGRAEAPDAVNVHSSIPGRVLGVPVVADPLGRPVQSVAIELGGEFEKSARQIHPRMWENMTAADLLGAIRSNGVVGLGGSLRATHGVLALPAGRAASVLVADGVECEPLMGIDYALMRERTAEIVEGMRICRKLTGAKRVVLALGQDSEDLVPLFEKAFEKGAKDFSTAVLPMPYPGGESGLILATLGKLSDASPEAKTDLLPIVLNIATLHAVYEAVVLDKPLTARFLTVTGGAVGHPCNLKARIGTRIADLFDECGGLKAPPGKVVLGGPMRGIAISSLEVPVTKGVGGCVAFTHAEARPRLRQPCIRCGRCIDACPWGLLPTRLFKLLDSGRSADAKAEGLSLCTACGCCSYVCPSHIPLSSFLGSAGAAGREGRDA